MPERYVPPVGKVERKEIRSFGELEATVETRHDLSGKKIHEITRNPDGSLKSEGSFEYDATGRIVAEHWNEPEDDRHGSYTYVYDAQGKQVDRVWSNTPAES